MGILLSLISSGASNFWNHTNDIEEDICNNKETILTKKVITQTEAIILSAMLYLTSIILIFYLSYLLNRSIYIYFLIWAFITWWYSDNIFLKKITGIRLKTHYLGELLTYTLAYPAYTMSIWLIFSDSISKGMVLSMAFFCFGIAAVLLKDLKDINGDREAGLKTLGVIFSPSKLIKMSCMFLILYFCIIIIATNSKIFSFNSFLIIIPFFYLIVKTYVPFRRKKWTLDIGDHKNIKAMILSTYSSLLILGVVNFI
jgi:4-hydroxybenzoate polyprenyltransferase